MYRGIRCFVPNEKGRILGNVLEPVDFIKYVWKIGNSEAYFVNQNNHFEDFFSDDDYELGIVGADLQRRFEENSYYTIFVDLQGYPSEQFEAITTYEDFVKSNCEIVILLTDCTYLDIYCKDRQLIEKLYNHAKTLPVKGLHCLSDENDGRTGMVAF
ncbi:hypothetical protein AEA09_09735 [Lysinibacillus contaminans]|uniref:DUF2691 domain-containing protein n=1 Tax=Lysinibacillus contaminans TaxID=1293441 RepID=A0ABR5K243_9BACI|nr:DUF2691 family protein [Lysinibacillus contaminans]KOS68791.1 hypothetical protein AEA09_09735 [Lysinibacillus contaminans]